MSSSDLFPNEPRADDYASQPYPEDQSARMWLAGQALTGLIASGLLGHGVIAQEAVALADAVIAELNKPKL